MFSFFALSIFVASFRFFSVFAQSTFSPGNVPLTSRSAYFNSRLSVSSPENTASTWPTFGPPSLKILGWAGYIKVDNVTYRWIGNSQAYNNTMVNTLLLDSTTVTPTRTILTLQASTQMQFNVTFLSPITPRDFVGWSLPLSYVSIDAASLDGNAHALQIYSDISGEWLSSDTTRFMTWNTSQTSPNIIHTSTLQTPQQYTDINGQANWGMMYFATAAGTGVTYKVDSDQNCRSLFQLSGALDNVVMNAPPRAIQDRWPILALSHDLGTITNTSTPVVIVIGFLRSPAVKLIDLSLAAQDRSLFYETAYSDPVALVNDYIQNYTTAMTNAQNVDNNLTSAAEQAVGGGALSDMVSLAVRQVVANTELTIARGTDGAWNMSDVVLFMRQGDGAYNRTQPVELLYASFPMFMTIDPSLGKPLLEPLLRLQSTPLYILPYAAPDLSSAYPSASLANQGHQQGVEQTGNMLIMSYAQARFSGDSSLVENYYSLLRSWADYLVNNSLAVSTQLTADPSSVFNETNLAIKGIIGVKAMSAIASVLGVSADATKYNAAASSLYAEWKANGALSNSTGNLLETFNSPAASDSTGYNIFADKWLNLSVVDSDVYNAQTSLARNLLGLGSSTYGIPIDNAAQSNITSSWDMFVSALVNDAPVQATLLNKLHARAGLGSGPGSDLWPLVYDSSQGTTVSGRGSPGQGAVFAPIALTLPVHLAASSLPSPSASSDPSTKSKSNAGVIAGSVIGSIIGLALVAGLVGFFLQHRRKASRLVVVKPLREDGNVLRPSSRHHNAASFRPEMLTRDSTRLQPFTLMHGNQDHSAPHGYQNNSNSTFALTEGSRSGESGYGGGSARQLPPIPSVGPEGTPLSSKALLHLRHIQNGTLEASPMLYEAPPAPASNSTERAPNSSASSEGGATDQLRAEIGMLRREMAQIREAGLDLPPGYE